MGMRVAVIGLGVAGLSAALAAAARGDTVVGFEQYDLDNDPASSGGRGKIIRYGYDDPFYASLMRDTWPRWDALAAATGRTLIAAHGGLHMADAATIDVVERGITDADQPTERLRPHGEAPAPTAGTPPHADAVEDRRVPTFGLSLRDDEHAVLEPTAGIMWPREVRAALAEAARAAGATLHERLAVEEIRTEGGLRLRTPNGVDGFDRVILAGGPWAFRLAPDAADGFEITRRFQVVFVTETPLGDGLPRPWIDHAGIGYYGMINVAPGTHLVGLHAMDVEQPVGDPGEPTDDGLRERTLKDALGYAVSRFGIAAPRVIDVRTCHYTSTPTRDFVIDDCPGHPGVILLSPCSGHGFKFGIITGEYAARLAHDETIPDRERFRLRSATMI